MATTVSNGIITSGLLKEAYLLDYQELESRTKELLACEQGAA
jgi:hypothetical protein